MGFGQLEETHDHQIHHPITDQISKEVTPAITGRDGVDPTKVPENASWTERALRNAGIKRDHGGKIITSKRSRQPLYNAKMSRKTSETNNTDDLSHLLPSLHKKPMFGGGITASIGGSASASRNLGLKQANS